MLTKPSIIFITLALVFGVCGVQAEDFAGRTGSLWGTSEWSLSNSTYSGNPFDVEGSATFTHQNSGETITTTMFFAGNGTWKFRFLGTKIGRWDFVTESPDPDLGGSTGTIEVNPAASEDTYGLTTRVGNKWARYKGNNGNIETFVPHFRMELGKWGSNENFRFTDIQIDNFLDQWMEIEGFNGVSTFMAGYWVDIDSGGAVFRNRDPDFESFEILESLIQKVYARGGVVHIWYCGDSFRNQSAVVAFGQAGANTAGERRLLRYIAARLGPMPGWIMGYGYDNDEHVNTTKLRSWGTYLRQHMGYDRVLGARDQGANINYTFWPEADFYSRGHGSGKWLNGVSYSDMVAGINSNLNKLHSFDERWWISRLGSEENIRRQLWDSNMAGGASSIIGNKGNARKDPFTNPQWFKTFFSFWSNRFLASMQPDNSLSNGYVLATNDKAHYIFYKESTNSLSLNLQGFSGTLTAIAVDAKKAYAEIPLTLTAGQQTWQAPYSSDWAIAVGDFQGQSDPDNTIPVITSVAASPEVVTDMSTALSVTATDADNDTLSYNWNASITPAGALPAIGSGQNPVVTFDQAGEYTFVVTVSDGRGGTDSETVGVTVQQTASDLTIYP